jgi:50S ribosomal protein L16 3-hydroxylase
VGRVAGRDAALMRELADRRSLDAKALQGASAGALDLLRSWCEAGWLHANGGAT